MIIVFVFEIEKYALQGFLPTSDIFFSVGQQMGSDPAKMNRHFKQNSSLLQAIINLFFCEINRLHSNSESLLSLQKRYFYK